MVVAPEIVAELNANGFAIVEGVLSEHETLRLLAAIERLADVGSKLQRRGEVFAHVSFEDRSVASVRTVGEEFLGNDFD